jgi:hypothetical protein
VKLWLNEVGAVVEAASVTVPLVGDVIPESVHETVIGSDDCPGASVTDARVGHEATTPDLVRLNANVDAVDV